MRAVHDSGSDGTQAVLIGREQELQRLSAAAGEAAIGNGSLLMLAGEAGVGKTSLAAAAAEQAAQRSQAIVMRGAAGQDTTPAYGSMVAALRSRLRSDPDALADCGPMLPHLALLMPELGEPASHTDQATLFEAIRAALELITTERAAIVILDDLQWSDGATLDLLSFLAAPLRQLSVLVIGIYRSDESDRMHSMRRFRTEGRRNDGAGAPSRTSAARSVVRSRSNGARTISAPSLRRTSVRKRRIECMRSDSSER